MTLGDRLRRLVNYEERSAVLLTAPVFAVLGVVAVYPIAYSFYISLYDVNLTRPFRRPFVGLGNYVNQFASDLFWIAVARTVSFTLMSVTAIALIALFVALLLNETFRGRRILGALLLVPWAIPTVTNGLLWKWIYDPKFGSLNGLLYQLGMIDRYVVWLGDPDKTMALIANAFVWKEMPLAAILVLVTMKAIPDDLYRAAKVDGANVLQRFVHVTLPSVRPGFMLVIIYETMMAIRHFDLFFLLTEGGPADASYVLSWQIYVETFRNLKFGAGAALSYIVAMVTFGLAWIIIRRLGQRL